jgi:hypothetical protein
MQVDLLADEGEGPVAPELDGDERDPGDEVGLEAPVEAGSAGEPEPPGGRASVAEAEEESYRPPPMRLRFEFVESGATGLEPTDAPSGPADAPPGPDDPPPGPADAPPEPLASSPVDGPAAAARDSLARAKDLVQRGCVQEAIEAYLGIITADPTNLKARNNLGVLFDDL